MSEEEDRRRHAEWMLQTFPALGGSTIVRYKGSELAAQHDARDAANAIREAQRRKVDETLANAQAVRDEAIRTVARQAASARAASYVAPAPDRNAKIVAFRAEGLTLRAIGERFGISGGRVAEILRKAERIERRNAERKASAKKSEAIAELVEASGSAPRIVQPQRTPPATENAYTPEDEWRAIQAGR